MGFHQSSDEETSSMLHKHTRCCPECGQSFTHVKAHSESRIWLAVFSLCAVITIGTFASLCFTSSENWLEEASSLLRTQPKSTCQLNTRHLGFDAVADELEYQYYFPDADAWSNSSYAGEPSDAKGLAWEEIQTVRGVRVSAKEALQMRLRPGLRLEGDDRATILGVAHNLHCLRMIRQFLYSDYYYGSVSKEDMLSFRMHADHCIETLRESVMCLPDLTPHSLTWRDESERIHVTLDPVVRRQCVNWDSLIAWERSREYHLDNVWQANPAKSSSNMAPGEPEFLTHAKSH